MQDIHGELCNNRIQTNKNITTTSNTMRRRGRPNHQLKKKKSTFVFANSLGMKYLIFH